MQECWRYLIEHWLRKRINLKSFRFLFEILYFRAITFVFFVFEVLKFKRRNIYIFKKRKLEIADFLSNN